MAALLLSGVLCCFLAAEDKFVEQLDADFQMLLEQGKDHQPLRHSRRPAAITSPRRGHTTRPSSRTRPGPLSSRGVRWGEECSLRNRMKTLRPAGKRHGWRTRKRRNTLKPGRVCSCPDREGSQGRRSSRGRSSLQPIDLVAGPDAV